MPTTTRYFVRRHRDGKLAELARIRRSEQGLFGEYLQAGGWCQSNSVINYLLDPLAADEISEPEAEHIAQEIGGAL